jgi:hypothetical protein
MLKTHTYAVSPTSDINAVSNDGEVTQQTWEGVA